MAKDILYIQNGEQVDPLWTNHIAISYDGVNWDGIHKDALSAGKHFISLNKTAPNSFPERNKEEGWVITIKRDEEEGAVLKFSPKNVENQPTWNTGAANENAGAQTALTDILSWLA
jgi:hypothetical protein